MSEGTAGQKKRGSKVGECFILGLFSSSILLFATLQPSKDNRCCCRIFHFYQQFLYFVTSFFFAPKANCFCVYAYLLPRSTSTLTLQLPPVLQVLALVPLPTTVWLYFLTKLRLQCTATPSTAVSRPRRVSKMEQFLRAALPAADLQGSRCVWGTFPIKDRPTALSPAKDRKRPVPRPLRYQPRQSTEILTHETVVDIFSWYFEVS